MCRRVNRLLCTLSVINFPFFPFIFSLIVVVGGVTDVYVHALGLKKNLSRMIWNLLHWLEVFLFFSLFFPPLLLERTWNSHSSTEPPSTCQKQNLHKNDCSWHTRNWFFFFLSLTLSFPILNINFPILFWLYFSGCEW